MHMVRDHHTGELFDPWAHLGPQRCRLLERSWAGVVRHHLLQCLPVSQVAGVFSDSMGRPSKDIHVVLGALILQQLHDLTDAAVIEALSFNLAWHYALDIRDESDAYLCEKTLRNYRRLVIDRGLDAMLFQSLTDQLIKAFGVETGKQRLDSTSIRSAMRTLTRLGIVVETISKFLRELARVCPVLASRVDAGLKRKYVEREGAGGFASTKPTDSKRRLPEVGRDMLGLMLAFRSTEAAELESFRILQRVLREQFEVKDAAEGDANGQVPLRVKEPDEVPCDSVQPRRSGCQLQ